MNRQVTVTGLPVDGGAIYITLWLLLPQGWVFAESTVLAAAPQGSSGNPTLVKEKLKKMNELLQKLIDDYQNDLIDEEEVRKRISEIIGLKFMLLDAFPEVWGSPFAEWYFPLKDLDSQLSAAWDQSSGIIGTDRQVAFDPKIFVLSLLEVAKAWKEGLERKVDGVLID